MSRSLMTLLMLVAACSHNSPKAAEPTPSPEPVATPTEAPVDKAPCEAVAAHTIQTATGTIPAGIQSLVVRHCRDDHWSLDLRTCMLTSDDDRCTAMSTPEQTQKFSDDLKAHGVTLRQPPPHL